MFLTFLSIVIAVLLIGVILMQMQSSGLSSSFGGTGEFFRSKRSIEKLLIRITVLLAALFATISLLLLIR